MQQIQKAGQCHKTFLLHRNHLSIVLKIAKCSHNFFALVCAGMDVQCYSTIF